MVEKLKTETETNNMFFFFFKLWSHNIESEGAVEI